MPFEIASLADCADRLSGVLLAAAVDGSHSADPWVRPSNSSSENGWWTLIILGIAALWVGLIFWNRSRKRSKQEGQSWEVLFQELCDLHNLSQPDRELLSACALSQNLEQPALAFVDPRILFRHIQQDPHSAAAAQDLVGRLFGDALMQEIVNQSARTQPASG